MLAASTQMYAGWRIVVDKNCIKIVSSNLAAQKLIEYTGEYTDADRVYIFELMSEKQDYYSNTFEWCREGIVPQIDNLIRISLSCPGRTGQS